MDCSLSFVDQMGNRLELSRKPSRIISLVPSQTELLFDLGLDEEVVGITKYCIHPTHWPEQKTIVGGTKNFQIEIIQELQPDLIIANREENTKEGIEELQKKYPVWVSEIYTIEDAFAMISGIGSIVSRHEKSLQIIFDVKAWLSNVRPFPSTKVLYLIWRKPWMAAGQNTFINDMLAKLGLKNCLPENSRYPELSNDELKEINPEVVFLSSEPYPFKEKHIAELQSILPKSKIVLVDGEMFSWYGSRLLKAGEYFAKFKLT